MMQEDFRNGKPENSSAKLWLSNENKIGEKRTGAWREHLPPTGAGIHRPLLPMADYEFESGFAHTDIIISLDMTVTWKNTGRSAHLYSRHCNIEPTR